MSRLLRVENRSGDRSVDLAALRRGLRLALGKLTASSEFDLFVALVDDPGMTQLNETVLRHEGTTDVITLDYAIPEMIAGEIYVCVPEARRQARRFGVPLKQEILRYFIHGLLHMRGYDDLDSARRTDMKKAENELLREVEREMARRKHKKPATI